MVSHKKHPFDRRNDHDIYQEPVQHQEMARNKTTNNTGCIDDKTVVRQSSNNGNHNQPGYSQRTITLIVPRWLFCYLPVVFSVCSVIIAVIFASARQYMLDKYVTEKTGSFSWEVVSLFSDFDKDGDFYLSLDEAVPLLLQFLEQSKAHNDSLNDDDGIVEGENTVTIEAYFSPLNLSTMTKDWEHDINNNESFYGLFNWQAPYIRIKDFGVSQFVHLLPDDLINLPEPGSVYTIVQAPSTIFGTSSLPSNRLYPPKEVGRGRIVHSLLSMFHPRPFLVMRFPPQGVLGCVRAVNEEYVEVVFRMHTEFQLNEPPRFPFWFTPAQFTGSLLMSRNGSILEHFRLYVPNERSLNIDMEWLDGNPENMEVDIGYVPRMELISLDHSRSQMSHDDDGLHTAVDHDNESSSIKDIKWDMEISHQEARDALELKMFPFKQVKYFNLSDAFDHAKAENKLVHSILLWGALDDQSC